MRRDDVQMMLRPLRLLTVALAGLALALPAVGIAAAADVTNDRGIVQSVDSGHIELRALDGSVASYAVSPATRVKLNGIRVSLSVIRPGYVATVVHDGTAPALLIRAFGRLPDVTDRGLVTALTKTAITLRTLGGGSVLVPLDTSTRFRFRGLPATRFLARPGAFVAVMHVVDGAARVVNVLKRARA